MALEKKSSSQKKICPKRAPTPLAATAAPAVPAAAAAPAAPAVPAAAAAPCNRTAEQKTTGIDFRSHITITKYPEQLQKK